MAIGEALVVSSVLWVGDCRGKQKSRRTVQAAGAECVPRQQGVCSRETFRLKTVCGVGMYGAPGAREALG